MKNPFRQPSENEEDFDAMLSVSEHAEERKRYHVVDETGAILWKADHGIYAYDHAGNLSDATPDTTFSVIDTRDGSVYGTCRNGVGV